MLIMIPLWLLLFVFRLYDPSTLFGGYREYTNVFNGCTIGIMRAYPRRLPRSFPGTGACMANYCVGIRILFMMIERFAFRRMVYWLRSRGHLMSPTYIVGANAEGVAIAEQLMSTAATGVNIIGFLDDTISPGEEVCPDWWYMARPAVLKPGTALWHRTLNCRYQRYSPRKHG